ncbi:hypothetical protein F2P79_018715 [Pimephales promelas]|nr:hypothetical protein F2P79_018715 [Pimephales promelas]
MHKATASSAQGDLTATVGNFPLGKSPQSSHFSSCTLCLVEFPDEFDIASHAAEFSDGDELSITASGMGKCPPMLRTQVDHLQVWYSRPSLMQSWRPFLPKPSEASAPPCPERSQLNEAYAYSAAGLAVPAFHAMAILQVHQTIDAKTAFGDRLRNMSGEGHGAGSRPGDVHYGGP